MVYRLDPQDESRRDGSGCRGKAMIVVRSMTLLGIAGLGLTAPALAAPVNPCGKGGCPTDVQTGSTTIIPSDAIQFRQIGDNFLDVGTEVNFGGLDYASLALQGFSLNFGGGATSQLFISKNGLVSFGAPLTAYQNSSLAGLNLPVIAPYYAKLSPAPNDTRAGVGDVVVQFGSADVFADGGSYSMADLLPAVRITWYGVTQDIGAAAVGGPSIYAQLVLAGSQDGSYSTAKFRYGAPGTSGEAGVGSIAGFSLYGTSLQFGGPYTGTKPAFIEYSDGQFIGQGATVSGAVPEPATWATLIAGFALLGYALRRRHGRVAVA